MEEVAAEAGWSQSFSVTALVCHAAGNDPQPCRLHTCFAPAVSCAWRSCAWGKGAAFPAQLPPQLATACPFAFAFIASTFGAYEVDSRTVRVVATACGARVDFSSC